MWELGAIMRAIVFLACCWCLQASGSTTRPPTRQQETGAGFHYLFADTSGKQVADQLGHENGTASSLLDLVLGRVGPDMRPASGFQDYYPDIDAQVARLAWRRMHEHASRLANQRLNAAWPLVEQTLREARVSGRCLEAAQQTAQAAGQLKTWAIQLLNSWGSFPAPGIFEGTLGDLGSFHGCLRVPANEVIGHAHYCTLSYRPVLPARRDYELVIEREPSDLLANLFAPDDAFSELAKHTQYNHFVYFKLGACFPIGCSPADVQRLARKLGRRASLLSGPIKCHSNQATDYEQKNQEDDQDSNNSSTTSSKLTMSFKDLNRGIYIWKPQMTRSQLVALLCVGSLIAIILALTLADLTLNRLPSLLTDFRQAEATARLRSTRRLRSSYNQLANSKLATITESSDSNNNSNNVDQQLYEHEEKKDQEIKNKRKLELYDGTIEVSTSHLKERSMLQAIPVDSGQKKSLWCELIHDCSLITSISDFLAISEHQLKTEILCLNGLRCITMSWIILAHTIQYNDWSAFARIYDVEMQLLSWLNQPIFNASYLVDTFFLMSGLLTAYGVFKRKRKSTNDQTMPTTSNNYQDKRLLFEELWHNFSCKSYLIGRYLRLTPQILLVSLLFILLPLSSSTSGPHWMAMTGEYSENCSNNWWINLLHLQAFYKADEMCNFVCWWISVDMFYHLMALLVLVLPLLKFARPHLVMRACLALVLANGIWQAHRHYQMRLPPNLLSTIPQVGAMWSEMTLKYFWTPAAHLFPFIFGFYLGVQLTNNVTRLAAWFTPRRALIGWSLALAGLLMVLMGTHWWVVGAARYTPLASTTFNLSSQLVWSLALAWTILACHFGYGHLIGRLLSCRLFIVLSRASYLVYLSHFLILFTFFGSQNLLLEPTRIMIIYIILGNITLSMMFGSLLHVFFELPWLRIQKRIMRHI